MSLARSKRDRADDAPSALQCFLAELDRLDAPDRFKGDVRRILRSMVGQRLTLTRRDLVRADELQHARRLLAAGASTTTARAALVRQFGFSRDTAERLVTAALAAGPVAMHSTGQQAGQLSMNWPLILGDSVETRPTSFTGVLR